MRKSLLLFLGMLSLVTLQACQSTQPGALPPDALSERAAKAYAQYRDDGDFKAFKAFVVSPDGKKWGRSWAHASPDEAVENALRLCPDPRGCRLYALGNTIVFHGNAEEIEQIKTAYHERYKPRLATDVLLEYKRLKRRDIMKILSARTVFHGKSFSGQEVSLTFMKENKLALQLHNIKSRMKKSDKGAWWMTGDSLCRRFKVYYSGKPDCYSVYEKTGSFAFVNRADEVVATLSHASEDQQAQLNKKLNDNNLALLKLPKRANSLGKHVGYSEICAEYSGEGAPVLVLSRIKEFFKGNKDFQSGYEHWMRYLAYDRVSGLHSCQKVEDYLVKIDSMIAG